MKSRAESLLSVAFAVLVHALMGGALLITWDTDVERFVPDRGVINAQILTVSQSTAPAVSPAPTPVTEPAEKPKPTQPSEALLQQQAEDKARIETQKKRELELQRREQEARQREQEQARQAAEEKAQAERERAEAERAKAAAAKAKAEAERKAAEARKKEQEAKRLAEEKRRAEQEKAKREAEEKAKREAAERAKRLAEEERKRAAAAAEAERLRAEQEAEAQARAAIASQRLARSIVSAIDQKVRRNWRLPPGSDDLEVHLRISLAPTGDVLAVNVAQTSGNRNFDSSARNAVERSSPFREMRQLSSSEFEKNFRTFTMIFKPGGR